MDKTLAQIAVCGRTPHRVQRFHRGVWRDFEDVVTEECRLAIRWKDAAAGREGAANLRTWPHDLGDLAAGHALLETDPTMPKRAVVTQTGDRAFLVLLEPAPVDTGGEQAFQSLPADVLLEAMRVFIAAPGHWEATGCFHRAGVFDPREGVMMVRVEDIGRHNCLDRLTGWANRNETGFADKVLLVSARFTGSLAAKALRAGFRVLVSRSAVTTDAIAQVQETGAALIGFARPEEDRLTLFSDALGRVDAGK